MSVSDDQTPGATDYAVGYGKPPVATRFQKGRSGNPRGRKPGSKNMRTLIERELDRLVTVTEGGRRKKKRKRDIIAAQLVNRSAGADLRAIAMLVAIVEKAEAGAGADHATSPNQTLDEKDEQVIAGLKARLARQEPGHE